MAASTDAQKSKGNKFSGLHTVIFFPLCGLAQEMRLNESQSSLGITGELVSLSSGSYLLAAHHMTRIAFELNISRKRRIPKSVVCECGGPRAV